MDHSTVSVKRRRPGSPAVTEQPSRPEQPVQPGTHRRRYALLVFAAILYVISVLYVFPFEIDDSYISMRYAENLAGGHGLVFNPEGPRVEGYTNLLLVLIESVLHRLGIGVLWAVKILLLLCGLTTILVTGWYAQRRMQQVRVQENLWWLPGVAALLIATSSPFILWTAGGLETVLFAMLATSGAALYCLWLSGGISGISPGTQILLADVLMILSVLTRPEGLLLWGISVLHRLAMWLRSSRREIRGGIPSILISGSCLLAYGLWKMSYFGRLLPASYLAKEPDRGPRAFIAGVKRFLSLQMVDGNWMIAVLLVGGAVIFLYQWRKAAADETTPLAPPTPPPRPHRPRPNLAHPAAYLGIVVGLYTLYVISLGFRVVMDDAYRMYVPLIPLVVLLLVENGMFLAAGLSRHAKAVGAALVVFLALLVPLRICELREAWNVDLNWGYLPYRVSGCDVADGMRSGFIAMGKWLRENTSAEATIVLKDAGAIPYFSKLNVIDVWSLTDGHLVELNCRLKRARWAGNTEEVEQIRRRIRDYIMKRQPDYILEGQERGILLDDAAIRACYRPLDVEFVYLDWYICNRRGERSRYVLKPWQRIKD